MKLWIRSQGKMKLVKVNYCYIREWQDHFAIEVETFDSALIVGEYKTKERALEVLDEIQNILQPKPLVIGRPIEEMVELLGGRQVGKTMKMKQDFEFKELSACVYEMPEE